MPDAPITIALDAMGGDRGVEVNMRAAARLSREDGDVRVLCVGDMDAMQRQLDELPHDPARLLLAPAIGAVSMDASPAAALAQAPECSILTACALVAAGEASAVVSAGHTGATVLAAARSFERLPGIRRAALASVYPTARGRGPHDDPFALMLDVGATLNATAADLVGFAIMGAAYSSVVSEVARPRVALLSNGTEANKGTPEIVEAHRRLSGGSLKFAGNVEGLDIPKGTADVVVCAGFLGNVVLKMLEGMGDVIRSVTEEASSRRLQWRLALSMLEGGLSEIERLTDWEAYGGAPLLGFDRPVIKAHGRSEARAIRNACRVAAKTVRGDLVGRIREGVASMDGAADDTAP